MPTVVCKNDECQNRFYAQPMRLKGGLGKYCSRECYYIGRKKDTKKRNAPNTICSLDNCSNEYYISAGEKNEGRGKYCSHKCYGIDRKGKKLSEEHKQKIGIATKRMWKDGIFNGICTRKTHKKKKVVSKRRDVSHLHTPEAIEKRRQKSLGRKQTPESNKKRSETLKGRKFTVEHRKNLSLAGRNRKDIRGKNSIWWKGGVSSDIYPDEFSEYLKRSVRKRDNYECQCCNVDVYKSRFGHVHHIDGDKQNCKEENLVLICMTCHNAIHERNNIISDKILEHRSKLK